MKVFKLLTMPVLLALALGTATARAADPAYPKTIEDAVNGKGFRRDENRARDKYRHPIETLKFFGLKPQMTVVEIWPSSGWYAEIIAPFVAEHGKYIAAVNPKMNDLPKWTGEHPQVPVTVTDFDPAEGKTDIAPAGSVDMVVTFRNLHNWMKRKSSDAAFAAIFKALKPGGILGLVEHRLPAKRPADTEAKTGYVHESDVIQMAEKAGFMLVDKSEINANKLDKADHPNGVWTLPPTNKHDKKDDAKYRKIGESDRMTLIFKKPSK